MVTVRLKLKIRTMPHNLRIALTYAALNDVDVTASDIQNAYFQVPSSDNNYVICGKDFVL